MYKSRTLLISIWILALLYGCSEGDSRSRKNLLLICIDTVRADTFFALSDLENDALSKWEDRALVFDNAQAPAPWTVPSIASVFTGLWPAYHGAGLFPGLIAQIKKVPPSHMPEHMQTIAQSARKAGFDTASISNSFWTSGHGWSSSLMRGFDETHDVPLAGVDTDWHVVVQQWSEQTLPDAADDNFFHYLHLMDAHEWHKASGKELERKANEIPDALRAQYREIAPRRACPEEGPSFCENYIVYSSAVRAVRDGIASTLDTLQSKGLLDNTIVVVFADHGEEFLDHYGDHRMTGEPLKDVFAASTHGHSLYVEQLHVPLLVWHPDYEGQHVEKVVSLLDIVPSVAAWLDLDLPVNETQAKKLEEALAPVTPGQPERVLFGSALSSGEQQISALKGGNKAIWNLVSDRIDYYDISADPAEQNPISNDQLVMTFDGLFLDYIEGSPKRDIKPGQLNDEQVRRLQSIGYLQGVETKTDEAAK